MIAREKVLLGMKCCTTPGNCGECPYDLPESRCINNLLKDGLQYLQPVEPIIVSGRYECGECRYELRPDADSYCPCCGKKVAWDG